MARKKNTKSTTEFPEPMSRNEAILQNILGASNPELPPMSRIEVLLLEIKELIAGISEPYTAGDYIDITDKEISTTLHAGDNITIDEDGAINAAGGGGGDYETIQIGSRNEPSLGVGSYLTNIMIVLPEGYETSDVLYVYTAAEYQSTEIFIPQIYITESHVCDSYALSGGYSIGFNVSVAQTRVKFITKAIVKKK